MKYVIEVQKICDIQNENNKNEYEHVGYINKIFSNQRELRKYVKDHNTAIRWKGSRYRGYLTSTHPETGYRYFSRLYRDEKLNLPAFI